MAFVIKETGSGNFEPCPEGEHRVVCIDVEDLGMQDTQFGQKHKCLFKFQTEQKMENGHPYMLFQRFNVSLHENSSMRPFLEKWRGKKFSQDELKDGFDIEKLIGINANVYVTHEEYNDKTYANIQVIKPPKDGDWKKLKPIIEVKKEQEEPKTQTVTPQKVKDVVDGTDMEFDTPPDTEDAPF